MIKQTKRKQTMQPMKKFPKPNTKLKTRMPMQKKAGGLAAATSPMAYAGKGLSVSAKMAAENKAKEGISRIKELVRPAAPKNIVKNQVRLAKEKALGAMKDTWKNKPSTGKGVGY